MRPMLLLLLPLVCSIALSEPVSAQLPTSNVSAPQAKGEGNGGRDGREGGESYEDAIVIGQLPYTDSGATCDNINDLTLDCGYGQAPDVVYAYSPASDGYLNISLCGSGFDTVLEVQDGEHTSIACNDDFCSFQSAIENLVVNGGQMYYIIVDGYGTACGDYVLEATDGLCSLFCAGWPEEGEPPCGDGYIDTFNGGCNGSGWSPAPPLCRLCGRSGTYIYNGYSYRDTDWFDAIGSGEELSVSCVAEFPLQILLIYGTDCDIPQYDIAVAGRCEEASLSRVIGAGEHAWIWVGPAAFSGVPCESVYLLEITGTQPLPGRPGACCLPDGSCAYRAPSSCESLGGRFFGYCVLCEPDLCPPPTPVERVNWGEVKKRFAPPRITSSRE